MLGIMLNNDGLYNDVTKPYFISYKEEFRLKTDLPYVLKTLGKTYRPYEL